VENGRYTYFEQSINLMRGPDMNCTCCQKRWYCITACAAVNSDLSRTYEKLPAVKKTVGMPWGVR
jgi:hypothetical protein